MVDTDAPWIRSQGFLQSLVEPSVAAMSAPHLSPQEQEYRKAHFADNRGPTVIGVDVALVVVANVMVGMRLLARRSTKAALMIDDYLIVVALVRRIMKGIICPFCGA